MFQNERHMLKGDSVKTITMGLDGHRVNTAGKDFHDQE